LRERPNPGGRPGQASVCAGQRRRGPSGSERATARRTEFIQRIPRCQRYELTSEGYRLPVFFSKTYTRIVNPSPSAWPLDD
jgi:hypothetical protein